MNHLNRQIPPIAHTPMYNFHKYWSRKTWNVVGEFIEAYCPADGIVFDPFVGSGVSAIEALRRNRRAIVCDLNPIATELTRLSIKYLNSTKLVDSFNRIESKTKDKIMSLYQTKCKSCKKTIYFDCAIWEKDKCNSIRYKKCPYCGDEERKGKSLTKFDTNNLKSLENRKIQQWYPKNKLYHVTGNPFKEKQQYESLDQLFTKRNLYALSILIKEIEKETDKDIRDFLKISFSSMVHLCSKMNPISEAGHFTPFSSAWTQHSYWFPSGPYMEQNVWYKFESSINGHQGLLKAKSESNSLFSNIKFGKSIHDVIDKKADIFIYTGDCLDLMKNIHKYYGDSSPIDYIFTDPPYDSSIQYGELSFLWVSWLRLDDQYLEKIDSCEIINNEKQNKDFNVYTSLLHQSFNSMFDVLKSGKYLTLTFHNPSFKVRNATIRAGVLSGFQLEKIHHQELARPSAKSLLQPFGSAQGDFYLRFNKPTAKSKTNTPEEIDEIRFDKIVTDTTIRVLAERGEPTPYTIIINTIDPELAKRGYYSELNTGLNVDTVLKNHLGKEFTLYDGVIGGASGKLWWFKKPNLVAHLQEVPLSERVEQTVLRQLQAKGKVSFTEIWEAISISFPNSLTSDQTSIKSALEDYARPVHGGQWLIKNNFRPGQVENDHTSIIAILAEIGLHYGFRVHIGKNEHNHEINTIRIKKTGKLKQYINEKNTSELKEIINPDIVGDIDILWIKDKKVHYSFEVESTTSMTSALQRGSNLKKDVKKVMIIPEDRTQQFLRKNKSPMFNERYNNDNWHIILFGDLYKAWDKCKSKVNIDNLFTKQLAVKKGKSKNDDQLSLFINNEDE